MNSKIIKISTYLGLFLVLTGLSYLVFGRLMPVKNTADNGQTPATADVTAAPQKQGIISFTGPKTEACPINGQLYTSQEKDIWSKRRPMEVMIENHVDARPQSGLNNADIVYETVAEGGITRFMGVFYCGAVSAATKYDVGPVRSARTYFLDLASEYGDYPLYAHVGGANCSAATSGGPCTTAKKAQALEQISSYGWTNKGTWGDLSEFSLSYKACRREPERTGQVRATEHTMYCSTNEMWNVAADRGLTNLTAANKNSWTKNYRPWQTTQKDAAVAGAAAKSISFDFWSNYKDYSVRWDYDPAQNQYLRFNGGQKQVDFDTGDQLSAKDVIVQFAKDTRGVDEHGHLLIDVVGSGKGILFQNGDRTDITWSKPNRLSRTVFKDASGKEVNFVPGRIWVEILPIGNTVSYEGRD